MPPKISSHKEIRGVIDYALSHGFSATHKGKHIKLSKEGQVVTVSVSPSCPYAADNARRDVDKVLAKLNRKEAA